MTQLTNQLLQKINELQNNYFLKKLIVPHEKYDLYQAYVFFLVLEAAKKEGAKVVFSQVLISNRDLTFRKKPGQIYSKVNEKNQEYLYATLDFSKDDNYLQNSKKDSMLEVHVGIRVKGRSDTLHECDVCVLEKNKAQICRKHKASPKHTEILAAVECKCYEKEFGIVLGREFIGLSEELESQQKYKTKVLFVASSNSNNTRRLLSYNKKDWYFNVLPSSQATNTNSAAKTTKKSQNKSELQDLISYLKTIFKQYKARS